MWRDNKITEIQEREITIIYSAITRKQEYDRDNEKLRLVKWYHTKVVLLANSSLIILYSCNLVISLSCTSSLNLVISLAMRDTSEITRV